MASLNSGSNYRKDVLSPGGTPWEKRHLVQFYENDQFLVDAVTQFAGSGLNNGEGVVIVATASHLEALEQQLQKKGLDVAAAKQAGQLILLDASEILSLFMVAGLPDKQKFESHVGGLIAGLIQRFKHVRAYGEMVNLLWEEENLEGTIGLENLWTQLAETQPFVLLCGYQMGNFNHQKHGDAFSKVCHVHTHVMPTENFSALENSDDQRRLIASLQQQATALKAEVEGRKKIEQALQEALVTRDEFLSIAGHELKTPLTALRLQIQLLQKNIARGITPEVAEKMKRNADNCDYQSERMARLINQLLDMTHIRSGKFKIDPTRINLAEVTKHVVGKMVATAVAGLAPNPGEINVKAPEQVIGRWDQSRMEQVIINLLTNAVKYGGGKPIDVEVTLDLENKKAKLSVQDHGVGISESDHERIFRRFEQVSGDENIGGLGLGLYIVRKIIDAHGGLIHVQSEPDRGSKFTVELPLNLP